jgi:outer membrane biosynthesis protein TonB
VAWSIADYLASLERGIDELLKEKDQPEAKAAPKAESKPEAETEAKPKPEPESKPEVETEAKPKPEPESKSEVQPEAELTPAPAPAPAPAPEMAWDRSLPPIQLSASSVGPPDAGGRWLAAGRAHQPGLGALPSEATLQRHRGFRERAQCRPVLG